MTYQLIIDLHGVKHPVSNAVVTQIEQKAVELYIKRLYRNVRKNPEYKEKEHYALMVQIIIQALR